MLDLRNSKVLLRTEMARVDLSPPGRFSSDGRFFACGMSEREIRVWRNTATGYTLWNNLRSRSPIEEFSFSPTTSLILTWGPEGIQLLYPDDRPSPPSPDSGKPGYQQRDHLVAYSTDHTHIATARQEEGIITVLDSLSGTLRRSINTDMKIREIGVVDETVLAANEGVLARRDLKTGRRVHGSHPAREAVNDGAMVIDPRAQHLALSHDCSRIAFPVEETVFLYDVNSQKITAEHKLDNRIFNVRFSPNGHGLRVLTRRTVFTHPGLFVPKSFLRPPYYLVELDLVEDGGFGGATHEIPEDAWSWANVFSRGCRIWSGPEQWVVDPRGSKLLWLPPSWRAKRWDDARWNGDFLALLDGRHELPIIIEFFCR